MKEFKEKYIIKCPNCGAEYLPNEIYLPNEFFTDVEALKDENYKILNTSADSLNTSEEYCCDNCGTAFKVTASVSFTSEGVVDDFDSDYVVTINKDRIDLE